MGTAGNAPSRSTVVKSAISVTIAGLISSGHHAYGALAYDTSWRLVVSLWIPAFVLLILSMLYVLRKYVNHSIAGVALWIVLLGGVVFQSGFTLFECVYSHVLKNILFFGGASPALLERLFPAPAYHLPDNLLFEITGVAQIAGFWAAWWAWHVFSERRKAT